MVWHSGFFSWNLKTWVQSLGYTKTEEENLKLSYDLHIYATTCMHMWTNICLISNNYFKTQKASKKFLSPYIYNIQYYIHTLYMCMHVCVRPCVYIYLIDISDISILRYINIGLGALWKLTPSSQKEDYCFLFFVVI